MQKAKHEAKEAIDAREQHAEEMSELSETVEMATLDKEMAEEKAEALQLELEAGKSHGSLCGTEKGIALVRVAEHAGSKNTRSYTLKA